jgi:hypothetical protein
MGETLAWRKEEFARTRPVYQQAMEIIFTTCQKHVDKLDMKGQMSIPAYIKGVPQGMGDTLFTWANFIVDAQPGPCRNTFIKVMLRGIPAWLEQTSAKQTKYREDHNGQNDYSEHRSLEDEADEDELEEVEEEDSRAIVIG